MNQPSPPSAPAPSPTPAADAELGTVWQRVRRLLLRLAGLCGLFVLFLLVLTALAGWYTSRSSFCRSCHIMEPYYVSWEQSSHHDVECTECHFEPGFGGKLRGKMLGLVQLAKYVTGSEGPRPAAEIPDASCLRSGCHDTRLLEGKVDFAGMPFDHRPHLGESRRGISLRCTSCHSQIVQGEHMAVTTATCFLCHFKNEPFNEGLAGCTHCHQIPDKKYDLGGGVMFDHELAYKQGVDCVNCHRDVVRGKGDVPVERCQVCHNREGDLARRGEHIFMHEKHVSDHKIDCLDCHLTVQHSLDPLKTAHGAEDCASCHPRHHGEQVRMLTGKGSDLVPDHAGGMLMARIGCASCHRKQEVTDTGTVLWKASAEACAMCHKATEVERLQAFLQALNGVLPELQTALDAARKAALAAEAGTDESKALARIDNLRRDLDYLRIGKPVHNIHYASKLVRVLHERITTLCKELKVAPPPPLQLEEWK